MQIFAQPALIVKQEGAKVYLDISEITEKPKVNDTFTVTFWGSELKNPKTGKVLGKTIERRLSGTITAVEKLFAVGDITNYNKQDKLENLEADITILPQTVAQTAMPQTEQNTLTPIWQSAALDGKALAFTSGDITGNGETNLILAYQNNNIVYL